ncbi:MAG: nuclear transport factor 2 family protein [Steroidobacteraceae bacterium]|jgi:hypothetical protein|nr:nuclear transport factor 2 family protein [Steroidobacteraceae bacterium]
MFHHRLAATLALLLPLLAGAPLHAQAPAATPDTAFVAARDAIWAKEKKIYEGRAEAGLTYYLANTSDRYVGWPPGQAKPSNLETLRKNSAAVNRKNSEKLELSLTDFTLRDSTAVIYYQTHRTVRPDGTRVDERFDTIHVWVREGDDWKLIGAMARPRP